MFNAFPKGLRVKVPLMIFYYSCDLAQTIYSIKALGNAYHFYFGRRVTSNGELNANFAEFRYYYLAPVKIHDSVSL